MKRSRIIVVLVVIIFIGIALFLTSRTSNNQTSESKNENKIEMQEIERKQQISDMKKVLKRSLKPINSEKIFNETTGLEPLPFDEVEKLEGETLQKRYEELDAKLDAAIQKNPDLPPIPEWYTRERDYVENKFFATIGKSRYKTELTEEQKQRQQKYFDYLEEIKKSGHEISDEELAKTKEQILEE